MQVNEHPQQHKHERGRCELCRGGKRDDQCCDGEHGDWLCTRVLGHAGPHAACGFVEDEHPIIEWEE